MLHYGVRKVCIGFLPLADCATTVLAHELGYFYQAGLEVQLKKEQSWQGLTRALLDGRVQAVHMLISIPLVDCIHSGRPRMAYGLRLSTSSNAVTIANRLWNAGVRDGADLRAWMDARSSQAPFEFGVVSEASTQELLLRIWMGGDSEKSQALYRVRSYPPQEMVRRLREGRILGFCAGEPWNQRAVVSKLGVIVATASDLMPYLGEKVLAAETTWLQRHRSTYGLIVAGILRASRWASLPENLEEASRLVATRPYVNTSADLVRGAMKSVLSAGRKRELHPWRFMQFWGGAVNRPDQGECRWLITELANLLGKEPPRPASTYASLCRPDIFDEYSKL